MGKGHPRGSPPALALVLPECLEKQVLHVVYVAAGRQRGPKDSPHHLPLVCIALLRECMLCVLASLQPLLLAGGQENVTSPAWWSAQTAWKAYVSSTVDHHFPLCLPQDIHERASLET